MHRALLSLLVVGSGCAHARLVAAEPGVPADPGIQRVVVIEPFFEQTDWDVVLKTEHATVMSPFSTMPQDVTITREVAEKPVFARVASLASEQQMVISAVARLRPSWKVTSTGGLPALFGPISLVRTIVGRVETVDSNRSLKNLECGFGILLPPLLILAFTSPVQETERVTGSVIRYETDAETARGRMLKYPTQPDYAIDTRGLEPLAHPVGLDVAYEEGVLAPEAARDPVLVEGFAQRAAAAVVAIVEEGR